MTSPPAAPSRDEILRAELAALTPSLARLVDEDWRLDAACAETGPDVFFPEQGDVSRAHREARRVCLGCAVRVECFASSVAADERYGTWGGVTAGERERIRRRRVAASPTATLSINTRVDNRH
ncbi:Hypothetical protein AJAP_42735 (plasmid) [Amycolatopsis japonica]|uniref:Transcriptional regulator WhiB n=1 Tax=Amycolatopsis japonica TaxID=208439 RepID=A0A075V9V4_9PSEU|nr:WhiB family transcriptional regulator [Amycolatopsis japonica]AIG81314.1 Hypothetical protein AJAP_42735 [Amycolatopsis japonica]